MRCRFHHASSVGLAVFWFALGTGVNASPRFASATLVAETVVNGQVDSGEGVAMSLCIWNPDATPTAHLTGTLSATSASDPQSYGSLAPNEIACRTYTFVVGTTCGSNTVVQLFLSSSAGGASLPIAFFIPVGAPGLLETFDSVVAPALPAGWAATLATGPPTVPAWATVPDPSSIAPSNDIFAPGSDVVTDNRLTSPSFLLPAGASTVSFSHFLALEQGFDGGVLEIAIGQGAFADIVAAGGSFLFGGYTGTISPGLGNPLAGRNAWTGVAKFQTVANLPAAAAGQSVRLRWRLGTDSSVTSNGWRVENIVVVGTSCAAVPTTVPWGLQGVANGNLVTFSWRQPVGVVPTGYLLEASVDAGLSFPFSFPTGSLTSFTAVAPDIPVVARVRAILPGPTTSAPSNTTAVAIGSTGGPGRITNLLSSVDGSAMTLAWNLPFTGGTMSSVLLEAGSAPGLSDLAILPLAAGATGFTAGGLPAGTYFIRMRAAGPVLAGQPSNEVTLTIPGVCTPPATPILFQVVKSVGTITIAWELPPLGTSAPSQFVLEAGTAPGTSNLAVVPLTGKSVTATPPPGNYHVRVFARNSCGDSAKTADVSFAIP